MLCLRVDVTDVQVPCFTYFILLLNNPLVGLDSFANNHHGWFVFNVGQEEN